MLTNIDWDADKSADVSRETSANLSTKDVPLSGKNVVITIWINGIIMPAIASFLNNPKVFTLAGSCAILVALNTIDASPHFSRAIYCGGGESHASFVALEK